MVQGFFVFFVSESGTWKAWVHQKLVGSRGSQLKCPSKGQHCYTMSELSLILEGHQFVDSFLTKICILDMQLLDLGSLSLCLNGRKQQQKKPSQEPDLFQGASGRATKCFKDVACILCLLMLRILRILSYAVRAEPHLQHNIETTAGQKMKEIL